jgi:hypothetical protein
VKFDVWMEVFEIGGKLSSFQKRSSFQKVLSFQQLSSLQVRELDLRFALLSFHLA